MSARDVDLNAQPSRVRDVVLASAFVAVFDSDSNVSVSLALTPTDARTWANKLLKAADEVEARAALKPQELPR